MGVPSSTHLRKIPYVPELDELRSEMKEYKLKTKEWTKRRADEYEAWREVTAKVSVDLKKQSKERIQDKIQTNERLRDGALAAITMYENMANITDDLAKSVGWDQRQRAHAKVDGIGALMRGLGAVVANSGFDPYFDAAEHEAGVELNCQEMRKEIGANLREEKLLE
jgi:hypothetical protein